MRNYGIFRLSDMIGSQHTHAGTPNGPWYRAVPSPYYWALPMRIRAAWWVVTGQAVAVEWPEAGELEKALDR